MAKKAKKAKAKEEKDRQEEVGLRQHSRSTSKADTHQGACALPPARLILPRLDEVQRLKQTQAGPARAQALTDPAFSLKVAPLRHADPRQDCLLVGLPDTVTVIKPAIEPTPNPATPNQAAL